MADAEKILEALRAGVFMLTQHARTRMRERNVRFNDIVSVGKTATTATLQKDGCYKVEGVDLDGDELTVIAAYENDTFIVTLF